MKKLAFKRSRSEIPKQFYKDSTSSSKEKHRPKLEVIPVLDSAPESAFSRTLSFGIGERSYLFKNDQSAPTDKRNIYARVGNSLKSVYVEGKDLCILNYSDMKNSFISPEGFIFTMIQEMLQLSTVQMSIIGIFEDKLFDLLNKNKEILPKKYEFTSTEIASKDFACKILTKKNLSSVIIKLSFARKKGSISVLNLHNCETNQDSLASIFNYLEGNTQKTHLFSILQKNLNHTIILSYTSSSCQDQTKDSQKLKIQRLKEKIDKLKGQMKILNDKETGHIRRQSLTEKKLDSSTSNLRNQTNILISSIKTIQDKLKYTENKLFSNIQSRPHALKTNLILRQNMRKMVLKLLCLQSKTNVNKLLYESQKEQSLQIKTLNEKYTENNNNLADLCLAGNLNSASLVIKPKQHLLDIARTSVCIPNNISYTKIQNLEEQIGKTRQLSIHISTKLTEALKEQQRLETRMSNSHSLSRQLIQKQRIDDVVDQSIGQIKEKLSFNLGKIGVLEKSIDTWKNTLKTSKRKYNL